MKKLSAGLKQQETRLLTVFLKYDQSKTIGEIQTRRSIDKSEIIALDSTELMILKAGVLSSPGRLQKSCSEARPSGPEGRLSSGAVRQSSP
jgi:hypothetical protein